MRSLSSQSISERATGNPDLKTTPTLAALQLVIREAPLRRAEMRNATGDAFAEPRHTSATSTVLIVMAIVIFLENAAVCLLFASHSKLRTTTNIFVVSLAVSDLLVGVLFVPVYLGTALGHPVNLYIVTLLLFTSLFNLCAVTYDRYHAILQPLTYHAVFTCRRITTVLVSVWCFPLLFIALPLIWRFQSLQVVVTVGRVYLGLMVLIVCSTCVVIFNVYYRIFKAIKRQRKMTRNIEGMFSQSSPSVSSVDCKGLSADTFPTSRRGSVEGTAAGYESPQIARKGLLRATKCAAESSTAVVASEENAHKRLVTRLKKHSQKLMDDFRAAKLVALIVLIFIICWLPVVIINFMLAIDRVLLVPQFIFDVSIYAFVANAFVNPLVYTFCKSDYRHAFLDASGCKRQRRHFNASTDLLEISAASMKRDRDDVA